MSPEQIHEIGRQTILELTGGNHAFVIAIHTDKEHIHNHIIFNATNLFTGKQFDWKVLPKQDGKPAKDLSKLKFEAISDKIASRYGAKIIEKSPKNSHLKYTMWQTENLFKNKIKQRLDFLLEHAHSFSDFRAKAAALNWLAEHDVTESQQLQNLKYKIQETLDEAKEKIQEVDDKNLQLSEAERHLLAMETEGSDMVRKEPQALSDLGVSPDISYQEIRQEVKSEKQSRQILEAQLNQAIEAYNFYNEMCYEESKNQEQGATTLRAKFVSFNCLIF